MSATGSTIAAKGPRFVLSGTQDGTAGKYDAQDNYASDSPSLAVNYFFNLNNTSADGSLSPGSAGQLQLNVKPLCNDLHDITVEMTWEISVQTSAAGTGTAADASKNEEIITRLKIWCAVISWFSRAKTPLAFTPIRWFPRQPR